MSLAEISETLDLLEAAAPARRHRVIAARAIACGGLFVPGGLQGTWDSGRTEISLHGIWADGADLEEAVRNWRKLAIDKARASA